MISKRGWIYDEYQSSTVQKDAAMQVILHAAFYYDKMLKTGYFYRNIKGNKWQKIAPKT